MSQEQAATSSATHANTSKGAKHFKGFVTLKYLAASVSMLIATFASAQLINALFSLWTGKGSTYLAVNSVLNVAGVGGRGGYEAVVFPAVAAVLFALLAFFLYRTATREIGTRPSYVQTIPYAVITNGVMGVLGLAAVIYSARLIGTLFTSLLVIGTGADISAMYLSEFLPDLFVVGLLAFMVLMTYKIATGKNMSLLMSIVLLSISGALLVAVLITVPVTAHSVGVLPPTNPNSSNTPSQQQLQQQYQQMYQQYLNGNY